MKEILVVSNLTKTFKLTKKQQKINKTNETLKVAVKDLSFSAYEGEIYGLLGPNGAGKTTTLRMISTLIKPDSGDVLVDGYSVINEPHEVRSRIGFLISELKLEEFFTPNYLFDYFSELYKIDKVYMYIKEERMNINDKLIENEYLKYVDKSNEIKIKKGFPIINVADGVMLKDDSKFTVNKINEFDRTVTYNLKPGFKESFGFGVSFKRK